MSKILIVAEHDGGTRGGQGRRMRGETAAHPRLVRSVQAPELAAKPLIC